MDFLGLTTTEQIRAVLTVSETDLPDEVIDTYGIDDDLAEALEGSIPTWEGIIVTPDTKNSRRLRLFAKYYCAATLAVMAQTFILKKDTDGSNEGQRSDKDGFAWMAPALLAKANGYVLLIQEDLGTAPEAVSPVSLMTRVVPDRDVITQPRALL